MFLTRILAGFAQVSYRVSFYRRGFCGLSLRPFSGPSFKKLPGPSFKTLPRLSLVPNSPRFPFSSTKDAQRALKQKIENSLQTEPQQVLDEIKELQIMIKGAMQTDDLEQALDLVKFKASVLEIVLGKNDYIVMSSLNTQGNLEFRLNRCEEAMGTLESVIRIQRENKAEETEDHCLTLLVLASVYKRLEKYSEAKETYMRILELIKGMRQKDLRLKVGVLADLARVHKASGDEQQAIKFYRDLIQVLDKKDMEQEEQEYMGISGVETGLYHFQAAVTEHECGDRSMCENLVDCGVEKMGQYNNSNFKYFEMALNSYEEIGLNEKGEQLFQSMLEKGSSRDKIELLILRIDSEFEKGNLHAAEQICYSLLKRVEEEKSYSKEDRQEILEEYGPIYSQLRSKNAQHIPPTQHGLPILKHPHQFSLAMHKAKKEIDEAVSKGSDLLHKKQFAEARTALEEVVEKLASEPEVMRMKEAETWEGTTLFLLRSIAKEQKDVEGALRYAHLMDQELHKEKYLYIEPVYIWNSKEIADLYLMQGDRENFEKSMKRWVELIEERSNGRDFIFAEFQLWRTPQILAHKNYSEARMGLVNALVVYESMPEDSALKKDRIKLVLDYISHIKEEEKKEQKQ